jgi:hypothetical protein
LLAAYEIWWQSRFRSEARKRVVDWFKFNVDVEEADRNRLAASNK